MLLTNPLIVNWKVNIFVFIEIFTRLNKEYILYSLGL